MTPTAVIVVRVVVVILSGLAGLLIANGISAPPAAGVVGGAFLGAIAVWLEWRGGQLPLDYTFWGVAGGGLGLLAGRKDLVGRIYARAIEFGLEARPMLIAAAVRMRSSSSGLLICR